MAVTMNGREYRKRDGSDPTTKLRYGGIGTGATATGGQTGTPVTAPTTTGTTGTTGYVPGQGVSDAQKAMEAAQANMPGAYTPGQDVTAAQQALKDIEAGKPGAYVQGQSVTDAKAKLDALEAGKPGAYQQSAAVTAAQQALSAINNSKPQGYESKYGTALDGILNQILNPQQFKYSFDGDELFKSYADLYTQKGRQASMDAMGQAAGLTGGYGNSYAQQVGNQAYDQYLLSLYDKGMDLRDRAYQQYVDQRADLYNQYNTLGSADDRDYGRYRDTVGDWQSDRDYATGRYDTERGFDYNKYQDEINRYNTDRNYYSDAYNNERNFDYGKYMDTLGQYNKDREYTAGRYDTERGFDYDKYQNELAAAERNRDYYTDRYSDERNYDYDTYKDQRDFNYNKEIDQRNFDESQRQFNEQMQENVRQFNESLDWDKMDANQKMAASWVSDILAMGQMPSAELLAAAGLSAEDAQKLMAQLTSGGSGGGSGKGKTKTYFQDAAGNYYEATDKGYVPVDPSTIKDTDLVDQSKRNYIQTTKNFYNTEEGTGTVNQTAGYKDKNTGKSGTQYTGNEKSKKDTYKKDKGKSGKSNKIN